MKKLTVMFALLVAVGLAAAVMAATYSVVTIGTGATELTTVGVAKAQTVIVEGSAVTNGTVIIKRVSQNDATTNTLISVTCTAGAYTGDVSSSNIWLMAGDKILRTGTATNGTVAIIYQ